MGHPGFFFPGLNFSNLYNGVSVCQHGQIREVVFQSLRCVQIFGIPWTAAHQASLFFIVSQSLFKLMTIELMMPSN